jgi:hypothetical protein
MHRLATAFLLAVITLAAPSEASALITGGEGNKPLTDPGWPKGAAAIVNHTGRIAWWEGPPFGGGQWHSECRGDAKALNAVLDQFAKLDVTTKRVVVHDGAGHSFWLAPNNEPEKLAAAKIDWVFMVWQHASWERLRKLPVGINPTEPGESGPLSQIDVFTSAIRWSDVSVPKGIEVVDQRLEAHGFSTADGIVLEGKVTDLSTKRPMTATIQIQRVEPRNKGGYLYPVVAEATVDQHGHWVLTKAPAGWVRVVVDAAGFVPRVAGYARFDDQPRWQSYNCGLARAVAVAGRIVDDAGAPLPDVTVRFDDVQPESGGRYESSVEFTCQTDAQGRFRSDQVPAGKATVWVHKPGYVRQGLGKPITMPKADVDLHMIKAASLRVTVDFLGNKRPAGYIVSIAPEGGEAIGSYGGSGNIDAKNQITFENVPPGRYVLRGQPNPSSEDEKTEPTTIDLLGGQKVERTLIAK